MATYVVTIPANSEIVKNISGRFVSVLSSTGVFEIDLENSSHWDFAEQGLSFGPWEFNAVGFKNASSEEVTATVSISKYPIADSRLNIVGALDATVKNFPADQNVNDPLVLAMLQNSNDQRIGLNKLGSSYAHAFDAPSGVSEIIAPSINTGGIIIRSAKAQVWSNQIAALILKGSAPTGHKDAGAINLVALYNTSVSIENRTIQSGLGVYWYGSGTGATYSIDFDIL